MPRGDRTGPEGRGSMTGRGLGNCRDREFGGRGFGRGFGRGRNFDRNSNRVTEPAVSEKTLLENEIRILKDQLNSLEKRLQEGNKE